MKIVKLIIEKGDDGALWGRVNFKNDLITDTGGSIDEIEKNIRTLIKQLYNAENIKFEYAYDLTALFEKYAFLNASAIGRELKMNESLFRQYTSGKKFASKQQVKKIEIGIHRIGQQLSKVELVG